MNETIIVALITALAAVLGTWLTMRGQVKSAEASIIGSYTKLVNDLRNELDRLAARQATLEMQIAHLEGVITEREKHIDKLTFALTGALNLAARNEG